MDDNKLAYLSLNISKPGESVKLTNKQHASLRQILDEYGLTYIDLYEKETVASLDLKKVRNSEAVRQKITDLLSNRGDIAFKLESWQQSGIQIITQLDKGYSAKLLNNLQEDAPAVIYALGNIDLFEEDGIAIVGSRNIDREIKAETEKISDKIISNGYSIVSGGASGVDLTAMQAALERGGKTIGFIKQNFSFKNLSRSGWNKYIEDGSLLLLSEIPPDVNLNRQKAISAAMNRNKYIYALAEYAIVVSSDTSGGTWQGAIEQIKKYNRNLFVLNRDFIKKEGNSKLLKELKALELPSLDDNFFKNIDDLYKKWEMNSNETYRGSEQIEISFG